MAISVVPRYDAFISCSPDDVDWVEEKLRPRLEKEKLEIQVSYGLRAGGVILENISQAIRNSTYVIIVLSPQWVAGEWQNFTGAVAASQDPAAERRKIIPLLLKDCTPPQWIEFRQKRDFRRAERFERECRILIWDLRPPQTVKEIPIAIGQKIIGFTWRHPWRVVLIGLGLLIVASGLLGYPQVMGWQVQDKIWDNIRPFLAFRAGNVVFVSTTTDFVGSQGDETGLYRKIDGESSWVQLKPPLRYQKQNGDYELAAISGFGYSGQMPERIFVSTSEVGVLQSTDYGNHWQRVGEKTLQEKRLIAIAVAPNEPARVLVAGLEGGLYRTEDAGLTWERIDGSTLCKDPSQRLELGLRGFSLLATDRGFFVGTGYLANEVPKASAGLYFSRDGGMCWERIHDAMGRYNYRDLVQNPVNPEQVLALMYDFQTPEGKNSILLSLIDQNTHEETPINWGTQQPVRRAYIEQGSEPHWYVATSGARVVRGSLKNLQDIESMPFLDECFLSCFPPLVLADTDGHSPMILMNSRLYRWMPISWLKGVAQFGWLQRLLPQ